MPKAQKSKTTISLPSDLWKRVKIEAIRRGVDAQDIVADALQGWMKGERK
jgi:hypothetical protein